MNDERAKRAGDAITRESFAIIRSRLGTLTVPADEESLIVRVAHTTGDVDFAQTIVFSPGSIAGGIEALREGRPVYTDVGMVRVGIRRAALDRLGCDCRCLLDDQESTDLAVAEGITRSAAAMRRAGPHLTGAVVAIGNAPTALFELLSMVDSGAAAPALIIGVPVGFVGALESKRALSVCPVPHITNLGERGGSPIAATLVNGLAELAEQVAHDG